MARKDERSRLPDLFANANKLQEVVKSLRKDTSANLKDAAESAQIVFDALMIEILSNHLDKVVVRLDPQRSQNWEDYYAVLVVIFEGTELKMPVPKLRSKDAELANAVGRQIQMKNTMIVRLWWDVYGAHATMDVYKVPSGKTITYVPQALWEAFVYKELANHQLMLLDSDGFLRVALMANANDGGLVPDRIIWGGFVPTTLDLTDEEIRFCARFGLLSQADVDEVLGHGTYAEIRRVGI